MASFFTADRIHLHRYTTTESHLMLIFDIHISGRFIVLAIIKINSTRVVMWEEDLLFLAKVSCNDTAFILLIPPGYIFYTKKREGGMIKFGRWVWEALESKPY